MPGVAPDLGVRRMLLHKFPYAVVYLTSGEEILVVAFAHCRRNPGYWRDRMRHD